MVIAMSLSCFIETKASTTHSSQTHGLTEGAFLFNDLQIENGLCTLYLYEKDADGNIIRSWTEYHNSPSEEFCDWLLQFRLDELNNPNPDEEEAPEEP